MKTREIWRSVPSAPGVLASSWGRVMLIPEANPNTPWYVRGGIASEGRWDGHRFIWQVRGQNFKVARLVCEAFHGPAPEDKPVCMHLDENSRNNRPENLSWGTQKENLNAPGFLRYCRSRTGENSPIIKGRRKKAA